MLNNQNLEHQGEIILYHPDKEVKLEVLLESETVWLNRQQLAELFARDVKTIGKHINNALKEELADMATVAKFAIVHIPPVVNWIWISRNTTANTHR